MFGSVKTQHFEKNVRDKHTTPKFFLDSGINSAQFGNVINHDEN
jgi:hypothetical protein